MIIPFAKIRHKIEFSSYYDLSNEFLPNDRYVTSTQCEISKSRLNYWRDGLLSWARSYHSENWFFWSYKKWRVTCSQCRSVYSDDSERHLRESNITETNIGLICSVYWIRLARWDWYQFKNSNSDFDYLIFNYVSWYFVYFLYWKKQNEIKTSCVTEDMNTTFENNEGHRSDKIFSRIFRYQRQ